MADEQKPIIDAFGEPRSEDGKIIPPPAPAVEEKKPEGDKGKEGAGKQPEAVDIEKHPVVVGLKDQIKQVKDSMGGNLSEQRKIIDRLEKDLKDARDGKKPSIEPLFKDIKRVKDLPKEEAEAMTDAEKRLFDENADIKERMNAQHADAQKARQDGETEAQKQEAAAEGTKEADKAKAEFDKKAQTAAKKLAGTDTELANKIIENFNLFKDNEALDNDGLAERMQAAARMIPTYTPPKQGSPTGGGAGTAVKEGGGTDDQFGTDEIIKQAQGQERGRYSL